MKTWEELSFAQMFVLFVFHTNHCLTGRNPVNEREFSRMFSRPLPVIKPVIEDLVSMGFLGENPDQTIFHITVEGSSVIPRVLRAGIGI